MPKASIPILCGLAGVILCFSPGLLSNLFIGISNFRDSIFHNFPWNASNFPLLTHLPAPESTRTQRLGFLVFSLSLIALGLYAALFT